MAKIVVVTSGKGGVGKTTTSASFATGLALRGHKTVVIDFDVGLRNLDLIMGCERRVVYDFVNVLNNEARLQQALIRDKDIENLYIKILELQIQALAGHSGKYVQIFLRHAVECHLLHNMCLQ